MNKGLAGKLLAFNKKVGSIKKDLENPYFKSQYFDVNAVIEVIRPILNEVGLITLQPLTNLNGQTAIKTIIIDSESGEEYNDITFLPEVPKAQEMGSAITYFRRYALVSMLLLQGEQDDDGNVASNAKPKYQAFATNQPKTRIIQNPANDLPFIS